MTDGGYPTREWSGPAGKNAFEKTPTPPPSRVRLCNPSLGRPHESGDQVFASSVLKNQWNCNYSIRDCRNTVSSLPDRFDRSIDGSAQAQGGSTLRGFFRDRQRASAAACNTPAIKVNFRFDLSVISAIVGSRGSLRDKSSHLRLYVSWPGSLVGGPALTFPAPNAGRSVTGLLPGCRNPQHAA